MVKDPVFGMEIDPQSAFASREHMGNVYYFCSADCLKKFETTPGEYQLAVPSATTGVGEGKDSKVRLELPVAGLNRSGGPALAQVIKAVPGVSSANVNVGSGRVSIEYNPERVKATDFVDAVRRAGFSPAGQSLRLKVSGLYCAEC